MDSRPRVSFRIAVDDLSSDETRDLLRLHLAGMHASSPPGHSYALDLSGLQTPDITVWSGWEGARIAAIGALKALPGNGGEVKSMRTHPDFLRRGAAAQILDTIIATAKSRGYSRLSLETGSGPDFEAALAFYRRRGFTNGEAFADYVPSDFNQFLHLDLNRASTR